MKCPTCTDVTLTMTERNGIEIDYCPNCRGVWLDRGELDKIIEKSIALKPEPTIVNRGSPREQIHEVLYKDEMPYDRDKYYERDKYYKNKRKKSFLEELFD
jgi:Zn-finger nucleic acid-binding protein